jgi:acyl carrier protein
MDDVKNFIDQFLMAVDFQDPVDITPETHLIDLPEWDSLAALGVIVMFDIEYGKTIVGDDLKNSKTIKDLYGLLSR